MASKAVINGRLPLAQTIASWNAMSYLRNIGKIVDDRFHPGDQCLDAL